MNEENPFNTANEEVKRLADELREAKQALRDVSRRLSQIEARLRRTFPALFPVKSKAKQGRVEPTSDQPTLTAEKAMEVYEELVGLAKAENHQKIHDRLGALGPADLNLIRRELGASIGKKKPSRRTLEEAIIGRIRESVLLSRHSQRKEIIENADSTSSTSGDE